MRVDFLSSQLLIQFNARIISHVEDHIPPCIAFHFTPFIEAILSPVRLLLPRMSVDIFLPSTYLAVPCSFIRRHVGVS